MRPQLRFYYGADPLDLGRFDIHLPEYMTYLYLPVRMPLEVSHQVRLPHNLEVLRGMVEGIANMYADPHDYVYVTAKRGHGSMNRPGWHCDGFGTDDLNFVWSDNYQTTFVNLAGEANHLAWDKYQDNHVSAVLEMTKLADRVVKRQFQYPANTLTAMDQHVIHEASRCPPSAHRQFVKVTISKQRFNLEGNSHNPYFQYEWKLYPRDAVRNMEHHSETDSVPDDGETQG